MPSTGIHVKNRFREQRGFGQQDRGGGNEHQPRSKLPDNFQSNRRPDHHMKPKDKPDGKGWNQHAEGIIKREMEDAFHKLLAEAVRLANAQPQLSTGAADHAVRLDPKPPQHDLVWTQSPQPQLYPAVNWHYINKLNCHLEVHNC
ncbi:hypothetical protein ATANTOWER_005925 [Ataeniobius toweri]|uniref:Uncharacterized protein n=1 Tax=Ataeniobius toweri TaxID=208326 RepID=A0ABU7C042_9TELE|nr:hypothetical protein [Ataeniobius toweri]